MPKMLHIASQYLGGKQLTFRRGGAVISRPDKFYTSRLRRFVAGVPRFEGDKITRRNIVHAISGSYHADTIDSHVFHE